MGIVSSAVARRGKDLEKLEDLKTWGSGERDMRGKGRSTECGE